MGATPTGEFRIWVKVRSQLMSGGNKNDNTYYYLPNVPYVMFFIILWLIKAADFLSMARTGTTISATP